jgi:hypothetical protein
VKRTCTGSFAQLFAPGGAFEMLIMVHTPAMSRYWQPPATGQPGRPAIARAAAAAILTSLLGISILLGRL